MSSEFLTEVFKQLLGSNLRINEIQNLSGGCINHALKIDTSLGVFFTKYHQSKDINFFEAEKKGLELLLKSGSIKIPNIVGVCRKGDYIFLVLEFIDPGRPEKDFWRDFGVSLANLHRVSSPWYGLDSDNYIGSLRQSNTLNKSWIAFFIEQRLNVQLKLAFNNGKVNQQLVGRMEDLYLKLPNFLIEEQPALLHGDLWSGNVMINSEGKVVLIDPAVYYGNREAELAFTLLFGGFGEEFYRGYRDEFPLEKGFEKRVDLYNLYPLLVHVNLFGGGYLNSVNRILANYL